MTATAAPEPAAVRFRKARRTDVPGIVRLLADDPLGATRETYADPLPAAYLRAFDAIAANPAIEIIVAVQGRAIVGCLQLTITPGLTRRGMIRGQIEGVRVAASLRGRRVGEALIAHAVARAEKRRCGLVELTTDKARPDAHRFYERLGFKATHIGMKKALGPRG